MMSSYLCRRRSCSNVMRNCTALTVRKWCVDLGKWDMVCRRVYLLWSFLYLADAFLFGSTQAFRCMSLTCSSSWIIYDLMSSIWRDSERVNTGI
ncbi:hypothetical protein BDN70DRAFT_575546 [Pholiota conissans]|uniref:Uncharacterized protein n=1 Tax=Pholiota conissans TaxID=109636 RepID=A0A9P5YKB5_9AGAR|nr:hypothetical protein BDN70DRAFT_575546 [Pholiota conissans]